MLSLALRNLWRNKLRTSITLLAIGGGLMLIMMGNNLNYGMYQDMIRTGISTIAGHVVVQPEGWKEDPDPTEHSVANADRIAEQVQAAWPEGRVVQRIFLGGLLNSTTSSAAVAISAVQPEAETEISDWHTKVAEGSWLKPNDKRGILIGAKLAETLEVGIGKKVVLMGQGKDEVNSQLFRVRGIIKTGSTQADGILTIVSVQAAQTFLEQPGAVTQVSLHLPTSDSTDDALAAVQSALAGTPGIEVLGWKDAVEEVYGLVKTDQKTNDSFFLLIGLIVALGIINTILMSVMERIREFGVMLALGTPPNRLRTMILCEGLVLGLLGASLGLALGSAVTIPLIEHGIDYSQMMGETMDMAGVTVSTHIKAAWNWPKMLIYSAIAVVLSVVATIYPAWKAGVLRPVEAMRHV